MQPELFGNPLGGGYLRLLEYAQIDRDTLQACTLITSYAAQVKPSVRIVDGCRMGEATAKRRLLRALALRRSSSTPIGYYAIAQYHDGAYECEHVSPYTKSAGNVDSPIKAKDLLLRFSFLLFLLQEFLDHFDQLVVVNTCK